MWVLVRLVWMEQGRFEDDMYSKQDASSMAAIEPPLLVPDFGLYCLAC